MDDSPQEPGGLMMSGRRLLRSIGDLALSRLEILLVELKEERLRLLDALLIAVAGIVCGLMTLILLTFTIVLVFWDEYRVLVLVLLTLLYGLGTGAAFWTLRKRFRDWQAFEATLEELKKDHACLDKQN